MILGLDFIKLLFFLFKKSLMVRNRGERVDDWEKLGGNHPKEKEPSSCRIRIIMRFVLSLVIFVGGIVIGLISSSHIFHLNSNWYTPYTSFSSSITAPYLYPYPYPYAAAPITNSNSSSYSNSSSNCTALFGNGNETKWKYDCLRLNNLVRPKELFHVLSDNELFWRASMVPNIKGYPYKRVPKVAFMFLTRGPLPFLPLWERFFASTSHHFFSIYVHTFPGFILDVSRFSVFFGRQIPSQKVTWGDISLADAEKRLLANALLDFSNERFVLISESCIPVYNFLTVYNYLTESVHSFVESYDDPSRYGRGRYSRWMIPLIRLHQWRKGSQWFEIKRDMAIEIISDYKYYDLFRRYCHPSCYPDEHYIPTYLNIFHASLNSNRTVTWVDWSLGGPHPATYGSENITEGLIQNIRNNGTDCWYNNQRKTVCYLFARKFAPSALEPLLNISSKVMGF